MRSGVMSTGRVTAWCSDHAAPPHPGHHWRVKLAGVVAELVRWARVCRVDTVSVQGVPHLVPVCHTPAGQELYFGSGNDATEVPNVHANSQITVTVDEYSERWGGLKGVMIQGHARITGRGPRVHPLPRPALREVPEGGALATSDSVIVEVTHLTCSRGVRSSAVLVAHRNRRQGVLGLRRIWTTAVTRC